MPKTAAANCCILLLDSDPLTRAVLHDVLQRAGYLVMEASDLGVAVDRIKMSKPDLLLVRPYISSMTGAMAASICTPKLPRPSGPDGGWFRKGREDSGTERRA